MKKLLLLAILSILVQLGYSQTITGTILDGDQGFGLIGATVLEKGTQNGTITDIDGNFELVAQTDNPVVIVSYIGYAEQEIAYTGAPIRFSLYEDANELDEIIVVGYGTQKKKVVTGAIAKVDAEDLEDKQVQRLEQALQGRTAGVTVLQASGQPGSGSTIRVRGAGSFGGNGKNDPLYVVDGVIINGGIDYLSPNDIESIEVLKDASAAIYGTKGANGVVLVTTKNGTEGVQLNYSTYYGTQNPARKLALANATEYAILSNETSVAAGGPILFDDPQALGVGTDWQDEVFRENAPMFSHELSLSLGSKKSKYFASAGYFDQDGIISEDRSTYKRFTIRLNSTHDITDRLRVGTTSSYAKVNSIGVSTNSEFGSPLGRAVNLDPITTVYEDDPANSPLSNIYENFPVVRDDNGRTFAISQFVSSEVLNPVAALSIEQGSGFSDKLVNSAYLEYEFIDGLKAKSSIGADLAFWGGEGFNPVFYLNATNRNDINSYTRTQNRGLTWIWENTLGYETRINNHEIQAVIGNSATRNSGEGIGGSVTDLPVTNIEDASLGFGTTPESQTFFGFEFDVRNSSLFGRLNYNFAERYLFTAIVRRDGSSKFGPNNKFGYFPSVLAGWNVTDESFFPANNIVNYLKIRGSWGLTGNDRINDFLFLPTVSTGGNYTVGENEDLIIGTSPSQLANPDLRWEQIEQLSIGFDAKLFRYFSATFDIYRKDTDGILSTLEVPGFVGFNSPTANVGNVRNEGIELELGYENTFGDWEVGVNGNVAFNRNELLFISEGREFLTGQTFGPQGLQVTRSTVGLPLDYLFGYTTDGLFQNQAEVDAYVNADGLPLQPDAAPGDIRFVDLDEDGDVDDDDRGFIGDGIPKWSYGSTVNLTYKNFQVSIFGQGFAGFDVFNITRRFDLVGANFPATALNRWTGEGTSDDFPRLIQTDPNRNFSRSSDFYVEDGSFFRLRNVQVSYTIPGDRLSRFGMGDTKIYVSGNNLHTFTNYTGFDPEVSGGVDRGQYPNPRTFIIGANVSLINKNSANVSDAF